MRYVAQEDRDVVKLAETPINAVSRRHFDTTVVTTENESDFGSCLHCPDMPCLRYSPDELNADVGFDMTFYAAGATCAFDALTEAADIRIPVVNPNQCVGCGVCLDRCPVGAIYLEGAIAEVESRENAILKQTVVYTSAEFDALVDSLWEASEWTNTPGASEIERLRQVFALIEGRLKGVLDARGMFGTLVRNLLIGLDLPTKVSVQGDTSNRIEIACKDDGLIAIGELEYHDDLLDSTRRLLADTAIAHSRHGLSLDEIVPMIVCLRLPNRRSGVYELLADIEHRLELQVALVPAGALLLLLAFGHSLDLAAVRETFTGLESDLSFEARLRDLISADVPLAGFGLAPVK